MPYQVIAEYYQSQIPTFSHSILQLPDFDRCLREHSPYCHRHQPTFGSAF